MPAKALSKLSSLFAEADNKDEFFRIFEKIKYDLTIDDLRTKGEDGSHQGETLLMLLAKALAKEADEREESSTSSDVFEFVWNRFKDKILLTDLTPRIEDGEDKGKSILWFLAYAESLEKGNFFSLAFEKFQNQITMLDLRFKLETNISLLRLLAYSHNGSDAFTQVWQKFDITFADLLEKENEGNRDVTLLWALTYWAAECFLLVWHKFKDQITLDHLREKSTTLNDEERGKTILWLIANEVNELNDDSYARVLFEIFEMFINQINESDLLVKPENSDHQDISLIQCLFQATWTNTETHQYVMSDEKRIKKIEIIKNIIKISLAQIPRILSEIELTQACDIFSYSISEVLASDIDQEWSKNILQLINARNALFKTVSQSQETDILDLETITALQELAKEAVAAGYLNAYYDIGLLFLQKNNPEAACAAFAEVPSDGNQYSCANLLAANILYGQAIDDANTQEEQLEYLNTALILVLRSHHRQAKDDLVQKIAHFYVKGADALKEVNYLHPQILEDLYKLDESQVNLSFFDLSREFSSLLYFLDNIANHSLEGEQPLENAIEYTPQYALNEDCQQLKPNAENLQDNLNTVTQIEKEDKKLKLDLSNPIR